MSFGTQQNYPQWLSASYYNNVPHGEVNWAQLAQQWITMKTDVPQGSPNDPHPPFQPPLPSVPPPFEPPPPEAYDKPLFPGAGGPGFAPPMPQMNDWPRMMNPPNMWPPPGPLANFRMHRPEHPIRHPAHNFTSTPLPNFMDGPLDHPPEAHPDDGGMNGRHMGWGAFAKQPIFGGQDVDYRRMQGGQSQWCADDRPISHSPDYDYPVLDMHQRKKLPNWIREGLEKMEKEKSKQEIEEQAEEDRRQAELEAKKAKGLGRFDSDSESETDHNDEEVIHTEDETKLDNDSPVEVRHRISRFEPAQLSEEELREQLGGCLRKWLTQILLSVTDEQVTSVCTNVYNKCLHKAQPKMLAQSSALAAISALGGDEQGDDSDDSDDAGEDWEAAGKATNAESFKMPSAPISKPVKSKTNSTCQQATKSDSNGQANEPSPPESPKSDKSSGEGRRSKKRKRSRSRERRSRSGDRHRSHRSRSPKSKRSSSPKKESSRSKHRERKRKSRERRSRSKDRRSRDRRSRERRSRSRDRKSRERRSRS